jgi:hypothetical protein
VRRALGVGGGGWGRRREGGGRIQGRGERMGRSSCGSQRRGSGSTAVLAPCCLSAWQQAPTYRQDTHGWCQPAHLPSSSPPCLLWCCWGLVDRATGMVRR